MANEIEIEVIEQRERLLQKGIPEIILMCKHLWAGKTNKSSNEKLFGVELCEECAKRHKETKH